MLPLTQMGYLHLCFWQVVAGCGLAGYHVCSVNYGFKNYD